MTKRQHVTFLVVAWIGLFVFLAFTHPHKLPLAYVIVPFVLVGGIIYATLSTLELVLRKAKSPRPQQKILWVLISVSCVLLLSLQSVGELTGLDVLAVLGLACIAYFYITRTALGREKR